MHYHNLVVVGQERPEIKSSEGEKLCGVCFGKKAKMAEILLGDDDKDDDPSSESSSSVMDASESEEAHLDRRFEEKVSRRLGAGPDGGHQARGRPRVSVGFGSSGWFDRGGIRRLTRDPGRGVPGQDGTSQEDSRGRDPHSFSTAQRAVAMMALSEDEKSRAFWRPGLWTRTCRRACTTWGSPLWPCWPPLRSDGLGLDADVRPKDAIRLAAGSRRARGCPFRMSWTRRPRCRRSRSRSRRWTCCCIGRSLRRPSTSLRMGKPSFEDFCEQMDQGEFRAMALRHFGSRNEDEEAETDQAKIMLMINHFIFARYRYPHRKVLDGVTPFVAIEYLNYICSKHVSLHRPSLKLIMNYEFQMRKEVMEEVNQGSTLVRL